MKETITSIEFRNFKAFKHYSIKLQRMNILVGPNNCGKSTVIGALRTLSIGLRRARAKSAELVDGPGNFRDWGYIIPNELLPISSENIHTDYADMETTVEFRLSNGNRLQLYFPIDGNTVFLPSTNGRPIRTPKSFIEAFPLTLGQIPGLGPVAEEESLLKEETVRHALSSRPHWAPNHFRNYWMHYPEGFEQFAELIRETWPGMDIEPPQKLDMFTDRVTMFCLESRIPREMYWAGFGFQIWCQLLTHIARASDDTLLILDEPEVYLHPDVQRQLLGILRRMAPDVILATHSAEIMGEADPSEIVLIDKTKRSAERLKDVTGVQDVLETVGSVHNVTLARLARNRKMLFVEDSSDFSLLKRFSDRLGLAELASEFGFTTVESKGFSSWEEILLFARGLKKAIGNSVQISAIYDRDYWCEEEIDEITAALSAELAFIKIHNCKEVENYLLVPEPLNRAVNKSLVERAKRTGGSAIEFADAAQILANISEDFKQPAQSQYLAKRTKYLQHSGKDPATLITETSLWFEDKWKNLTSRMEIVPGKDVLKAFRTHIQGTLGVSISNIQIVDHFRKEEIKNDLVDLLKSLDDFRIGRYFL